ncbi:hypothetical protein ISF_06824 [Cordyceps fumosorosea ARSEF 2679]|uniref:Uncharacterized protein n=1 Tax=Cordyceps fumosorosea (strain ARSEF 2679) TaxID=1081104 RepID=A0A167R5C1_CORFA|nr:hypothetical protein ISF_06824 [Cordyceps fumosorosea ARSEF 2679]OAA58285.1 hypothetical protein ISF_06824 [Cordyceps fumosorosea ARSEF 2679]
MTSYKVTSTELIKDALNRAAVWILILASVITGATSHQPKAFTMLYIFGALALALSGGMLLHVALRIATKKRPETNMRRAVFKLPLELVLLALLILCTYFGFSVRGSRGADGLVDGDTSSRRVACGFLGLVAAGAQLVHAPAAMVNRLKAKYAEEDSREKQNADAAASAA